jgi:hypothetical protein
LETLLGVPALVDLLSGEISKSETPANALRVYGRLDVVGDTDTGDLVAVVLQTMLGPGVNQGQWVGFVCPPHAWEELERSVESKITSLKTEWENRASALVRT